MLRAAAIHYMYSSAWHPAAKMPLRHYILREEKYHGLRQRRILKRFCAATRWACGMQFEVACALALVYLLNRAARICYERRVWERRSQAIHAQFCCCGERVGSFRRSRDKATEYWKFALRLAGMPRATGVRQRKLARRSTSEDAKCLSCPRCPRTPACAWKFPHSLRIVTPCAVKSYT